MIDKTNPYVCIEIEGTRILLEGKAQPLGGYRHYFLCQGCMCHRFTLRRLGSGLYRCAKCLGGRYASQRESHLDKAIRARDKASAKLGKLEEKPKWMRWHTYHRLRAALEKQEDRIWDNAPKKIQKLR